MKALLKTRATEHFMQRVANLHPGENLHTGANLHPLCLVHMPINCVHTYLDLTLNVTQVTVLIKEKFAVFECSVKFKIPTRNVSDSVFERDRLPFYYQLLMQCSVHKISFGRNRIVESGGRL